jgi:hypothetical protein
MLIFFPPWKYKNQTEKLKLSQNLKILKLRQPIVLKTILILATRLKLAKNTTFHAYLYISLNKNN